jgi:hypothetical protein
VGVLIARRSKRFCIIKCFSDLEVTKEGKQLPENSNVCLGCSARFKSGILKIIFTS